MPGNEWLALPVTVNRQRVVTDGKCLNCSSAFKFRSIFQVGDLLVHCGAVNAKNRIETPNALNQQSAIFPKI